MLDLRIDFKTFNVYIENLWPNFTVFYNIIIAIVFILIVIKVLTVSTSACNSFYKLKQYIVTHNNWCTAHTWLKCIQNYPKTLISCIISLTLVVTVYLQGCSWVLSEAYLSIRYFFFCYYYIIPFITIFILFLNNSILLKKTNGVWGLSFQTEVIVWNLNCWYFTNFFFTILYFFVYFIVNAEYSLAINNTGFASTTEIYKAVYQYNLFANHPSFNVLSISILLLAYLISMCCLVYLSEHGLLEKPSAPAYFMLFIGFTTILVTTENLLMLVISFELIFLPSLIFAYFSGYAGKSTRTVVYLTIWTLFGSFLILSLVIYLYAICGTLDYSMLRVFKFSPWEYIVIYFLLLTGFGIKIPVFPAHYWLTKVHVEASGGFSMFLSGFLVKTALYCFYVMHLIFYSKALSYFVVILTILGILESSLKMWVQTDLKKLIAYATIQEMNMILLSIVLFQASNLGIIAVFTLMHGTLSALLFFVVDVVNKRTRTRNIHLLSGISTLFPQLNILIWISLLNFFGFPFTVKFFLEWQLMSVVLNYFGIFAVILFIFILFLGNVGFAKGWFSILYGAPADSLKGLKCSLDLSSSEKKTGSFFITCLAIYTPLLFFF